MAEPAGDYSYSYRAESSLARGNGPPRLELSTSGGVAANPRLFAGRVLHPVLVADCLLVIGAVARSRFHVPPAMLEHILLLADPVATVTSESVRFEAFSSCCSAYVRLDLLPGFGDGEVVGTGTTNVDLGPAVRAALAGVTDADRLGLEIGLREIAVDVNADRRIERRVPLPRRWVRGFAAVHEVQAAMTPAIDVPGPAFGRLLHALPGGAKRPLYLRQIGNDIVIHHRKDASSVRLGDPQRLRLLDRLGRHTRRARVYTAVDGSSAWSLDLDHARVTLALSPDSWRGFSGEGRGLAALTTRPDAAVLARVRASLAWQSTIVPGRLADALALDETAVRACLAVLAAAGMVGYDVCEGAYFHRVLPFDEERAERDQPRLRRARQLVADGAVELETGHDGDPQVVAWVRGRSADYRVRLGGSTAGCSCPWWGRHHGERGPCAHILAVSIVIEQPPANGPLDDP